MAGDNSDLGELHESDEEVDIIGSGKNPVPEVKKTSGLKRVVFGLLILIFFYLVVMLGHAAVCIFIFGLQVGIFQELLGVRYKSAVEIQIPHFRTVHWQMFIVAVYQSYGEQVAMYLLPRFPILEYVIKYFSWIGALMYSSLFVFLVSSLRKGYLKYQLGQIAWSILTLIIVVFQLRKIFPLIFTGLIWIVLPALLVAFNDSYAYFAGKFFGKKFIPISLTPLSPNKSWEGFFGGLFGSLMMSWFLPDAFNFQYFVCPQSNLKCEVSSLFVSVFHQSPDWLYPFIKGVYISPIKYHSLIFALFASFIAPFGGFFASAIKRAYGKKDFKNLIPGHGGLFDRFDCHSIMLYYTCIHYSTFIVGKVPQITELIRYVSKLTLQDKINVQTLLNDMISAELSK